MMNPYPGKFIAFEGIDCSGKTTQAKMLKKYLDELGHPTIWTCEPYKNESLRERKDLSPLGRQAAFVNDRRQHLIELIIPALASEKNVIADRFMLSGIGYGMSEGLDQKLLLELHEQIIGRNFIIPDITFLIDVPVDVAMKRLVEKLKVTGQEPHYYERKEALEKVREAYLSIYADRFYKDRGFNIRMIDGNRPKDEIFKEIYKKTIELFNG